MVRARGNPWKQLIDIHENAGLNREAFFHYRKRIKYKILTHKRIKTGNFLSVYRAK